MCAKYKEGDFYAEIHDDAGQSRGRPHHLPQRPGSAVEAFCFAGYSPTVYFTTGPRTGTELAARYAHRYETLVCLGGDGTLSDAIAGLMRIPPEQRPRLGYIPMGTANDVANTLNLPPAPPRGRRRGHPGRQAHAL